MGKPLKRFYVHVQFEPMGITVNARNRREAKKKVRERLSRRGADKLIDKDNFFADYCCF